MKRMFVYTSIFTKIYDSLVHQRKLLPGDLENLEQGLLQNPQLGDVIPGMNGLRKARLRSANRGKSGGFRVDYLDFPSAGITYFVVLYAKNVKDDLSPDEKKAILKVIELIKQGVKNG